MYVEIGRHVDLDRQSVTAASLSDLLRILLLNEYGGIWVDATLFCNRPLDQWLPDLMSEGFFAFAEPGGGRLLSSWFLSAEPGNRLVSGWCKSALEYWSGRSAADQYFWFHRVFADMCRSDIAAAAAWSKIPKVSADGPHALQIRDWLYRPYSEVREAIDWNTPVFKLTHRLDQARLTADCLLAYLIESGESRPVEQVESKSRTDPSPPVFASLKVSTQNLGDHIQIIAGLRLLSASGIEPSVFVDRDDEIASSVELDRLPAPIGILLNGWFKSNRAEWPPHPKLLPLIIGFHIRLFQCPELVSGESIEFFRRYQPIGCRDSYTRDLLGSFGIDAFVSNCLSLTLPKRIENPQAQTEVFVVSRDERILAYMPVAFGPHVFINHYTDTHDFSVNMAKARQILEIYRTRAKLIVTTLLHCALPAIAMGIPVIVFYPLNTDAGHASDHERFSTLENMLPIYRFDQIDEVDWTPQAIEAGEVKLRIIEEFQKMARRWQIASGSELGPIAPASVLPPP